ncbi:MAG TPA: acetamidase/formamidase family protein [Steroidobacteraceae bacterium]
MSVRLAALGLGLVLPVLVYGPLLAADREEVTGRWEVTTEFAGGSYVAGMNLIANETGYKGRGGYLVPGSDFPFLYAGTRQKDGLHLTILAANGKTRLGELLLKSQSGALNGKGQLEGVPITVSAHRPLARPPGAARMHVFDPQIFYGNFSGTNPPALHIFPGDSVRTKTVDSSGFDEHGVPRTLAQNNPQTGPFYVEGAMIGDTLSVHFTKIRPNRDTATQVRARLNPNVVPRWYQQRETSGWSAIWKLDRESGTATPEKPSDKLRNLKIKLNPMLGCVAVAPNRFESRETGDLGSYGGNLDYNQIREGTTLYLPVYQAGALLTIGDGHATQGDGEITSQGLETSMDVEFTVDLIKDQFLDQPWAQNSEFIMVSGIGRSPAEALQVATGGLTNWLKVYYQLNSSEAATVLANAIHYDIAEVVDGAFHVVAKISKAQLGQLSKPSSPETVYCTPYTNCTDN